MGLRARITYRGWQFWKLLTSKALAEEERLKITNILSDDQMVLFNRQNAAGQQHAFRVFQRLTSDGIDNQDLLVAALLHDVGKIRYRSNWWDRSLVVILGFFLPSRIKEWGKVNQKGWRRPFVVREQHAKWGAEYAREAGCTRVTVDLILHHQDRKNQDRKRTSLEMPEATLLDRLLEADDKS